jgi:leader peptidase (prepilin peptidase) / N-methyltransferase
MYYTSITLLGLAIGSFLNVLIFRTMQEESLGGRSHCPHCAHTLKWYELVPLFSFLFLGGKCKECKATLSIQYPLVELATALTFLATAHVFLQGHPTLFSGPLEASTFIPLAVLVLHGAVWATLIAIFVYDLRTTYIPNMFSYTFALLGLCAMLLSGFVDGGYTAPALTHLLAGPLLFLPFYALWKVSEGRWMGFGDGMLAWGMGWFLGLGGGFSAVMFGFWIGAVVSLALLGLQRFLARIHRTHSPEHPSLTLKSEIPFGPFLIIGVGVVYFFGVTYASLFL